MHAVEVCEAWAVIELNGDGAAPERFAAHVAEGVIGECRIDLRAAWAPWTCRVGSKAAKAAKAVVAESAVRISDRKIINRSNASVGVMAVIEIDRLRNALD